MAPQFQAVEYGVDDLTLGFDMEGSPSVRDLDSRSGSQTKRGKMLGEPTSWGRWAHLLGRSVCFWKSDTKRLVRASETPGRRRVVSTSEGR
jgi:hypothetical protein